MHDSKLRRLVRKASEGDVRAFAKLYDEYAGRVFGFIRLRVRDTRDAEELTESVFVKVYRSLPTFEDRGLPFSAWVFRIARNEVVDFVRKSARTITAVDEPDEAIPAETCVDEVVLARLDAKRLRTAVESLTSEQAEVVIARFYWGLNVSETADAVGRTVGAVKALQHRAVRTLQRMLEAEDEVDEQAM